MDWTSSGFQFWFFPRGSIPASITNGSPNPQSDFGTPVGTFTGSGCNYDASFQNFQIIFDTTFCGDWAGDSYTTTGCSGDCVSYVAGNPNAFAEAYWDVNYIKVYTPGSGSGASSVAATSAASSTAASYSSSSSVAAQSSATTPSSAATSAATSAAASSPASSSAAASSPASSAAASSPTTAAAATSTTAAAAQPWQTWHHSHGAGHTHKRRARSAIHTDRPFPEMI